MPPKKTLQDCHELASAKGGKCLSTEYVNSSTKMLWECHKNHQWMAIYNTIQQGHWCAECALDNKRNTLQDCYNLSSIKNGKCLSTEYVDANTKYLWECSKGHQWEAKYNDIYQGQWCLECGINKQRNTIQDCYNLASSRNGKCLSTEYVNSKSKLLWECEKGHQWEARYDNIDQGQWCPECRYLQQTKSSNNSGIIFHWKTNEELVWKASYERKTLEYLNLNKIEFLWQPKMFQTPILTSKGNQSTYRPDAYLIKENLWVEVKGFMRKDAQEKWDWFRREYPNSDLWDKKRLKELGIL